MLLENIACCAQGAGRIDEVINHDAGFAVYFTNDIHDFGLVGLGTALVDDRETRIVKAFGQRPRPDDTADIRRDDDHRIVFPLPDVTEQHGRGVDVVHGHVEEALNLVRVQVHREHAVDAGCADELGHELRCDRHAGCARTPVLARVAKVRNQRRDSAGRGALAGIGHDEKLHEILVSWRAGRLDQEYVAAADVLQISQLISPSLKRPTLILPSGILRWCAMSCASLGWALPEKIVIGPRSKLALLNVVSRNGWGGRIRTCA